MKPDFGYTATPSPGEGVAVVLSGRYHALKGHTLGGGWAVENRKIFLLTAAGVGSIYSPGELYGCLGLPSGVRGLPFPLDGRQLPRELGD